VVVLKGMGYAIADGSRSIRETESARLFLQHARKVIPNFELLPAHDNALQAICDITQGMPLALVLAGSLLELVAIDDLATEIKRSFDVLETQLRDVPNRQRSIRATFDYSLSRLPDREQHTFAKLTVFRGQFTLTAARDVADASLPVLQSLINRSFLTAHEGMYSIHELLRQYGNQVLATHSDQTVLYDAHSAYYLSLLEQKTASIKGDGQIETVQHITRAFDNIRAGWRWATMRGRFTSIGEALDTLAIYFYIESRFYEGKQLFQGVLDVLDTHDEAQHRLYGRILSRMALLISQYHTAQSTLAHAQESLAIATQYDDLIEMAIAHEAITHCHIIVDRQLDKAQTHLDHSLSLHTTDGDPFYLARIYHKIGFCHAYLGDLDAMYDY
ncbi:MAG: hypothetical protein AAFQ07_18560, partial [Chloroflexota bacterium]